MANPGRTLKHHTTHTTPLPPHLDIKGAVGGARLLRAADQGHPGVLKVGEGEGGASVLRVRHLGRAEGGGRREV